MSSKSLIILFFALGASSNTLAETVCMKNTRVSFLQLPNNGHTILEVKPLTRSSTDSDYRGGYILIKRDNYERYQQKRDILLMSSLSGRKVTITSKGRSCIGNSDDFEIEVSY